jgi:hypothetical protein
MNIRNLMLWKELWIEKLSEVNLIGYRNSKRYTINVKICKKWGNNRHFKRSIKLKIKLCKDWYKMDFILWFSIQIL